MSGLEGRKERPLLRKPLKADTIEMVVWSMWSIQSI